MSEAANRDQQIQRWNRVASGWADGSHSSEAQQGPVTDWLIDRANPQLGQVVLDLAAGAGGLGHRVAELVGPNGRVISTDFAPAMVEAARRLGEAQGLTNIEYRTLDAERMDLADACVHIALCRSGIMVMPNPGLALRESRRVVRVGGSFAFSVFATPTENPWVTLGVRPFVERGLVAPPAPGGPGMFALGDAKRLRELVLASGFSNVEVDVVDYDNVFEDDAAIWHLVEEMNAALAPLVQGLEADQRAEMRRAVIDSYADYRSADGAYAVPARVFAVLAQ